MKKIKHILLTAVFIGALTSCKKGIDIDPVSTITAGSFFKTQDDVAGALRGMYVQLRGPATSDLYFMGEGRSEILSAATAGTTGLDRYYNNTLNTSNPGPNWQGLYSTINAANLLIKYIPSVTFTSQTVKNNSLAQAYTMRAFVYFCLVRTWGGVPIKLEPTESYDPAAVQVARSSVEDVFKLIKADIEMALSLYPTNSPDGTRAYWSKPATSALKGDVYLWTGKVQNGGNADITTALNALNDIPAADYQLLPNYSDIFSYSNKGNREELMAVRFQQGDFTPNTGHNYFANMYVTSLSNVPASTVSFVGAVGVGNTGNNIMQVSANVRNQFTTDDSRRLGTFFEIYDTSNPPKYVTSITTKGAGTVIGGVRYFYTDVILYRYAEVLLLKAEAKNALGQDPTTEINQVRQRAYGTNYAAHIFVNGTQSANNDAILKERLFELTTEGKRWWDLIRFGQVFNLVPSLQGKAGQTNLLLFPIGQTIRSLEPLVTENPGWQ